jgi:hypothetical protein
MGKEWERKEKVEIDELQEQIEKAYQEMIRQKQKKRNQKALKKESKKKDEQRLREILEKEEKTMNLKIIAEIAKENRNKNEIVIQNKTKNQKHLNLLFAKEVGEFEEAEKNSQLIDYDISQDNINIFDNFSKGNDISFPTKVNSSLCGKKEKEFPKTSNQLGNSSLLNEKDISLNYSGIDYENIKNGPSNEVWEKHPLMPNKQYFTNENNSENITNENITNKSFKKKVNPEKKAKAVKTYKPKSLKKKKINLPPRLKKKPNAVNTKKIEINTNLDNSLNYSIEYGNIFSITN